MILKLKFDIAFAPIETKRTQSLSKGCTKTSAFINVMEQNETSTADLSQVGSKPIPPPISLGNLYRFSQSIIDSRHDHPDKQLIVCSGQDPEKVTRCCLILGGYFIIHHNVQVCDLEDMFAHISSSFVSMQPLRKSSERVTVLDCWRALHRVRSLSWINFTQDLDFDQCIDMQEYLHYDNPANGSLHVIVPGKLLAFPCPEELPYGGEWADEGGARRFSAGYFADILADFGVQTVTRCGGAPYGAGALEQRRIGVEDLPVSGGGAGDDRVGTGGMMRAVDRFLTLMRLSPGAVAMHGAGPDGSLGPAGRLLTEAYLIRCHGFEGAEAAAWLAMVHPDAAARAAFLVGVEEAGDSEAWSRTASGGRAAERQAGGGRTAAVPAMPRAMSTERGDARPGGPPPPPPLPRSRSLSPFGFSRRIGGEGGGGGQETRPAGPDWDDGPFDSDSQRKTGAWAGQRAGCSKWRDIAAAV